MRTTYRLGRWLGVDIQVHVTFLLLVVLLSLAQLFRHGASGALASLIFTAAVFGVVVLHEMGHVLAARQFGIRTRDITLYPIGGVASLEREPRTPRQELLVSLAGPAVNVALALALAAVAILLQGGARPGGSVLGHGLLARLVWVNIGLAVFNLLPAFPLDGGRVLRALLEGRRGRLEATRIAARLGQLLAVGLGLYALVNQQLLLGLVALFIWVGAADELRRMTARSAPAGAFDPATFPSGSLWDREVRQVRAAAPVWSAPRAAQAFVRVRPSGLRRVPFFGSRRAYRFTR